MAQPRGVEAATRGAKLAFCLAFAAVGLVPVGAQEGQAWRLSGQTGFTAAALYQAEAWSLAEDAQAELLLDARRGDFRTQLGLEAHVLGGAAADAAAFAASAAAQAGTGTGWLYAAAPGSALTARLNRAYLRWSPGPVRLVVGRQVINWGKALARSPADLFMSLATAGLEPGRSPVDGARLSVALGDLGSLEAAGILATSPQKARAGARLSGTLLGVDAGASALYSGQTDRWTAAAELKADLGVGLWVEAAYAFSAAALDSGSLAATAGLEWTAPGALSCAAEYGWSQASGHGLFAALSAKAGDYASLAASADWAFKDDPSLGTLTMGLKASLDAEQGVTASLGGALAFTDWAFARLALSAGLVLSF